MENYNWKAEGFTWDSKNMNYNKNFDYDELLGLYYLMRKRREVVELKKSWLAHFQGGHRQGKTISAITLGYIFDPTFYDHFEKRLCVSREQYADALDQIKRLKRRGCVIIVDEAGTSVNSSEWFTSWMRAIQSSFEVMGYLSPIVFFCSPVRDYVSTKLSKMFNTQFDCNRTSLTETTLTPYNLKYNTIKKKFFYRFPVVRFQNKRITLKRLVIKRPPQWLIDRYEGKSFEQKDEKLDSYIDTIKQSAILDTVKERVDLDVLVEKVTKNWRFFKDEGARGNKIKIDVSELKYQLELKNDLALLVKKRAEKILNKEEDLNEDNRNDGHSSKEE